VRNGDRPLIRVMSNYTYFNVTGNATFINLRFTGLDMLAVSTCDLSYFPVPLCNFTTTPSSKVATLSLSTVTSISKCAYTCLIDGYSTSPYTPSSLLNFTKSNAECVASSLGMAGTTMCSGLPYNDNYFSSNKQGVFSKRHTILFNLYTFDGLNSVTIVTPRLNIINCDF
jgi:hypothetical protein